MPQARLMVRSTLTLNCSRNTDTLQVRDVNQRQEARATPEMKAVD